MSTTVTRMPVHHSPLSLLHAPPHEILSGQMVPYFESPKRYSIILSTLLTSPSGRYIGVEHGSGELDWVGAAVRRVHGEEYLAFLREIYDQWVGEGGSKEAVLPEVFRREDLLLEQEVDRPLDIGAIQRVGRYGFDLSAPITGGTWKAIMASARVGLEGAKDLLSNPSLPAVFSLCRPPGHHASDLCGGYCYLSNAAVATRYLQDNSKKGERETKVAILDIDYHHGNGTSKIFYSDPSVLYVSLHGTPDYPYYTGGGNERGAGVGLGTNINYPLPLGTDDTVYLQTLQQAAADIKDWNPDYLVVSLGVDTFIDDPITDFKITLEAGYPFIGEEIGRLGLRTLFIQEGGYNLLNLGNCVVAVLDGFGRASLDITLR